MNYIEITVNSNKPPWGLIREWGLICQNRFWGRGLIREGGYSGGGVIREWGLIRSFTVQIIYTKNKILFSFSFFTKAMLILCGAFFFVNALWNQNKKIIREEGGGVHFNTSSISHKQH